MNPMLLRTMLRIFLILSVATIAHADTFEFLTFTPPTGWTRQTTTDGLVYRRPSGIGLISLYTSRPLRGTPSDEFATLWREKIETPLSLKAPVPKIETDGENKVAIGGLTVDAQGTPTAVTLVTIVAHGRTIGVSTVSAGDNVLQEITAFLDTIEVTKTGAALSTPSASTNSVEVDFEVPPGYTSQRDGAMVVLKPNTIDRNTPCVYGISPSRPSSGSLERDARAAILEPLPGWQLKSEHYNAMRGTATDGWPYFWYRTDVQQMSGASMQYLTAMAMAFPNGNGRVGILWGFGSTGPCTTDDQAFLRVFFSLRPRGWTPDGGKAFSKELVGTWRNTEASGMAQYRFLANGRYEYGQGTSTTFGNLETRTGSVGNGNYSIRGSELVLTGGRRAGSYLVRIYDEFSGGMWLKTIAVLDTRTKPPLVIRYMRVAQ